MRETLEVHEPLLVNALGHSAGAVIFGIFLFQLLRDRAGAHLRDSSKAVAASALTLAWSLTSLAVIFWNDPALFGVQVLIALSSSAVSMLPAVLLDISLAGTYESIRRVGYALSTAAVLAHTTELFGQFPDFHRPALILTTLGFGALTICAAALTLYQSEPEQRRRATPRIVGSMSLFLFAMSFVHFGRGAAHAAWPVELVIHHAGIPFALFVLLQDYRSVFLDAMIRFFANILLAGVFAALVVRALGPLRAPQTGIAEWLYVLSGALVFVLFAMTRGWVQRLLTKLVFRRGDLNRALEDLRIGPNSATNEALYAAWVKTGIAKFFQAHAVDAPAAVLAQLRELNPPLATLTSALPQLREALEQNGIEAVVPLKVAGEPHFVLLGRRDGGRPYFSEDLSALALLANEAEQQIEKFRDAELRKLMSQAELRALQSQIHPHFLFNALNTLYGVIPREAKGARQTVLNLADIFRYFLRSEKTYIAFEEEMNIVKAYLEIESLRLGGKLRTVIDVSPAALLVRIPILSVQPLVENAVKHGVASQQAGGVVRLAAMVVSGELHVIVHDTGAGFSDTPATKGEGVGLENVKRRLELCYGPSARLVIRHNEEGTEVSFRIPVTTAMEAVQ